MSRNVRSLAIVAVALLVARAGNPSASQVPPEERKADFLFGQPRGFIGVRGGWVFASAGSDLYDFFSDLLTVEPGDFNAPEFGFDVAIALHPRVDAVFGLDFSRANVASEYRDFVEENDLPITQQTELTVVSVTGGVKLYLARRGREVSRYAFVPASVRPYVGGGGGFLWYNLKQRGDFVDFVDLSIFRSLFQSRGWGREAHLFGGADFSLSPKLFLSFEARYLWSDADLDQDFVGFEPIDLSGLRTTVALNFHF